MPTPKSVGKKAKASKAKSSKAGYRMPEPIPEGTVLTGMTGRKRWSVGPSIGVGGFGEIYCGREEGVAAKYEHPLAIKIEPHENGPLFVEMNFYLRAALPESIESFKTSRGLSSLGMPVHRGSGSHSLNGTKYRFLVMDRFGTDLQKVFAEAGHRFSERNVFNLAIRILDVLEYIHSRGYAHNDVKAQNLLLGMGEQRDEVFLVDFGLACRFLRDDDHVVMKADPRKAHDGTVEYAARDAHIGVFARRSDLEVLGYVHEQKKKHMDNIPLFLRTCFETSSHPGELEEFLRYVVKLDFAATPDYAFCRNIFVKGLTKRKLPLDLKLHFPGKSTKPGAKSASVAKEIRVVTPRTPKTPMTRRTPRTPTTPTTPRTPRTTRITSKTLSKTRSKSDVELEEKIVCSHVAVQDKAETIKTRLPPKSPKTTTSAKTKSTAKAEKSPPKPNNPEMIDFMRKAMAAASKASSKASSKRSHTSTDSGMDNPTPNMVEIMQKRARK